ncbi:MAG: PEGA domain-containing protein [Candidatus Sulfotelmatobacter sp.]
MSTKIGHFEILSELAKSPTGAVYKANDPESGQTIALKAIQLDAFGDGAEALEHALLAEAESTNVLSSSNISKVYGAGEIEGQFCAAMEYVQGNSIATMLARKEGFSIWDLLDIGRQLCSGLDHASSHNLVHHSLEPAKVMCGWDGTVKILSFGISSAGKFLQHSSGAISPVWHYMSPEQIRGDATDGRSNLYSLGAMFYEMVTERKAFDRDDVEELKHCILESMPVAPAHVNPKIHPLLSDLIMKTLAKDPAQRYQNGRELLDDLEKCKESKTSAAKKAEPPKGIVAPDKAKAAAQSKFVGATAAKPASPASSRPAATPAVARPSATASASPYAGSAQKKTAEQSGMSGAGPSKLARPVSKLATPKAAAAAAGVGAFEFSVPSPGGEIEELDLSDQFVAPSTSVPTQESTQPSSYMSAAVADEPQVETFEPQSDNSPKIAVDPMMAEGPATGSSGVSFSEMTELPPLKEVYVAPPPPPPVEVAPVKTEFATPTTYRGRASKDEKPKVEVREAAQKAISEIKGVPPKLYLYALGAAGVLILIIAIGVTMYIHSLGDDDAGAPRSSVPAETSTQPDTPQPAPKNDAAPAPVAVQPIEVQEPEAPAERATAAPKSRNASRKKTSAAAPVVIPGQLMIDSTPQGAQVQVDGASDPSWVTPFTLTNLQPGQHSVTISKAGFNTDSRTINVTSGNRTSASIRLVQLMATLVVKSDPPGANIFIDGRDMAVKTPAQVSLDKGQHLVLVRMSGYLDETMNGQFSVGQTYGFNPTLRALGNVDDMKTVGKVSRFFGGKGQTGKATLSIHTQPRGAQISINQRMLDKNSPVDVELDPGNYEVEITLSGYAPIRKIVTATKSGKIVLDEALQAQ